MVNTLSTPGTWSAWHATDTPLRIGVSSCLLGEEVRFDGGHARSRFVVETLGQWMEFVSVCPEMEIGMGTPRPTIRITENGSGERLVAPKTGEDYTERMHAYSSSRVAELQEVDLDGFVVKKASPSCGLERIRVYRDNGTVRKTGTGLFTAALQRQWPALPIEEDGRLNDARLRENFIERIFCRNRWRALVKSGLSRRNLVEFHTAHKLLVRSHNEAGYRRLGRIVASLGQGDDERIYAEYEAEFQTALTTKTTKKKNTNVLQHALGYLKELLDPRDKREILNAIDEYRTGMLPLVVPLTLLRFNIAKYDVEYLKGQLYFEPHPKELMLRNHC